MLFIQEKQLQVNMKINKLWETVKAHQEKVNLFVSGSILHNCWFLQAPGHFCFLSRGWFALLVFASTCTDVQLGFNYDCSYKPWRRRLG
jgi:hypothetical protein